MVCIYTGRLLALPGCCSILGHYGNRNTTLDPLSEWYKCSPELHCHQSSSRSLRKLSALFMVRRLNLLKLSMLVRLIASKLLRTALLCESEADSEVWSCGTGHRFLAPTMLPCNMMCHRVLVHSASWPKAAQAPCISFGITVSLHTNNRWHSKLDRQPESQTSGQAS